VRERDAAIDALGVARLDLEAALESSRLDALEARRAAAAAEGRARAAVVADQKDRPHSGPHDRRDRGFVAVEGERLGRVERRERLWRKKPFRCRGRRVHRAAPGVAGETRRAKFFARRFAVLPEESGS